MKYSDAYAPMFAALRQVEPETCAALIAAAKDKPFAHQFHLDSTPFCFSRLDHLDMLKLYFEHDNWAIRSGILYHDLAFINQVSGGSEWWTLKYFEGNARWFPFESISFRPVLACGHFNNLLERLESATYEQCLTCRY